LRKKVLLLLILQECILIKVIFLLVLCY